MEKYSDGGTQRGPLTWTLGRRVRKRLLENMISNVKPEDEQKLSGDLCVGEDQIAWKNALGDGKTELVREIECHPVCLNHKTQGKRTGRTSEEWEAGSVIHGKETWLF